MQRTLDKRVIIFTFRLIGKDKTIRDEIEYGSMKDTIETIFTDELDIIFKPPKYFIYCNSVVILEKYAFVSIHTTNKKVDFKKMAKFIIQRFNFYFKVDKSIPFLDPITLELERIEEEPSLKELEKKAFLPGFKVKDIEYADYSDGEDEVIVTFTREFKIPKKETKRARKE